MSVCRSTDPGARPLSEPTADYGGELICHESPTPEAAQERAWLRSGILQKEGEATEKARGGGGEGRDGGMDELLLCKRCHNHLLISLAGTPQNRHFFGSVVVVVVVVVVWK